MKKGPQKCFLVLGPKAFLYAMAWVGLTLVSPSISHAQDDFDFDIDFEEEFNFSEEFSFDGEDWFDDFDIEGSSPTEQLASPTAEEQVLEPSFEDDLDFVFDPLDPVSEEDAFAEDSVWDEFFAPEAGLDAQAEEMLILEPEGPGPDLTSEDLWASPAIDPPDYALEARLHQIFLNYNSQRVSDADWSLLLGGREAEVYEIQRGDTLWGISRTFFGDGNYWPKIWSLNAEITNPHLIRPGNSIRFIMGDLADAPAFAITETEQEDPEMSALVSPILEADGDEFFGIEIPPPLEESRPVVMRLPPSLPIWDYAAAPEGYDETGVDYIQRAEIQLNMNLPLPAYLAEREPEAIGRIVELEMGGEQAGLYQYAYVSVRSGVAKPGDRLTVVRPRDRLRSPNSEVSISGAPLMIETGGVVELVELVDSRVTRSGQDMFRAMIVQSVNPILPDSLVLQTPLPRGNFARKGNVANIAGQIIGGVHDRRSHYFATHSIVFLNRGSAQGLREADILTIRANPRVRNPRSIVREVQRQIGQVKVIQLAESFSAAVVLSSSEGVFSGDYVGGEMELSQLWSFEGTSPAAGSDSWEDEFSDLDDFDSMEGFEVLDGFDDFDFDDF